KKKAAKQQGAIGAAGWQRGSQQQQGAAGGWNAQGTPANNPWGQAGQQQASAWGAQQQQGAWGAQNPAQQQQGAWGTQTPVPPQQSAWGVPGNTASGQIPAQQQSNQTAFGSGLGQPLGQEAVPPPVWAQPGGWGQT